MLKDHLLRDDEAAEAYRRILAQHEDEEALEFLLERMKRTKNNKEFFATMAQ